MLGRLSFHVCLWCAFALTVLWLPSTAAATNYGPPKDSGPARDVASVRQVTFDAATARGWKIVRSSVFLVDVRDNFAVAWVGYKGASGAVLENASGSWKVLNWRAVWGGGDATKNQLIASGASPATAAALAAVLTPHISPQVQGWDTHIQAGNGAALKGDMAGAIEEYQKADSYTLGACDHEIIKVNIKAAKEILALEQSASLRPDQASSAYWKRQEQYWIVDPCNRP